LKPKAFGGPFPFTVSFEAVRDIVVVVIHVFYFVIMGLIFAWWQKRGAVKTKEVETSSYGRPLMRKA
jgi:phosphotransferase system  glucose/maltose/N-acetylglucosamine-specific IIC component